MTYIANKDRYSTMQYRRVGDSGLKLPVVSLGLWHNFGTEANYDNMKDMLTTAFDLGITHFDLANNYGPIPGSAEENFGKILHAEMMDYRDEMIISTKAGYIMWDGPYGDGGTRKYLNASLNQSLKRMNLDYVDIFYHHRMDKETPLEETMTALNDIVKSGRALYVGLSNYDGETMVKASKLLEEMKCPFIINQNKYSMMVKIIEENGLKKEAVANGKGIIAFSPLAQGLLTDKYLHGIPTNSRMATGSNFLKADMLNDKLLKQISQLNDMATKRGQTLAQMALSWVLKDNDVTSVLIGASSAKQIRENVEIINNLTFTAEELATINNILG